MPNDIVTWPTLTTIRYAKIKALGLFISTLHIRTIITADLHFMLILTECREYGHTYAPFKLVLLLSSRWILIPQQIHEYLLTYVNAMSRLWCGKCIFKESIVYVYCYAPMQSLIRISSTTIFFKLLWYTSISIPFLIWYIWN